MPSLKYKMTEKLFAHTLKSVMSDGTKEEFIEYVYSMASRRHFEVPGGKWKSAFSYEEVEDDETTICKIGPKGNKSDKLVLYFTGDGLYQPPALSDFDLCSDIVKLSGRNVWLVSYPLITAVKIEPLMESVMSAYRMALEEYAPENIALMGLSSGGSLCLGICFFIREKCPELPLPERLILQSPMLCSPPTEEQLHTMRMIEPYDVISGIGYFNYLAASTSYFHYEYLVRPMKFDMTGFPPIDIFYGTYEMGYAYLEDFAEKCEKEGVKLGIHTGDELMRCWCLLSKTPEAEKVKKEYAKILKM